MNIVQIQYSKQDLQKSSKLQIENHLKYKILTHAIDIFFSL